MASNGAEYLNLGTSPRVAAGYKESVARFELRKGESTSSHSHAEEIAMIVVSGVWRFYLEGRSVTVGQDQMLHLPAHVEHRAEALTDAIAVMVLPTSSTQCCSAFVQRPPNPPPAGDSAQDPDQYLWGV
jgi:mannose-6-phosphate isomerase-like protein (cupin superfamily)